MYPIIKTKKDRVSKTQLSKEKNVPEKSMEDKQSEEGFDNYETMTNHDQFRNDRDRFQKQNSDKKKGIGQNTYIIVYNDGKEKMPIECYTGKMFKPGVF